jgi:hypothetical protein
MRFCLARVRSTVPTAALVAAYATCLAAALSSPLLAQPRREYHPRITSVSPRNPTPRQTVTITGTDLDVPTWRKQLRFLSKYGGRVESTITLSGTATTLTFSAPDNMRADSIRLDYIGGSQNDQFFNFISSAEQRISVPSVHVQSPPRLDNSLGIRVAGGSGEFRGARSGTFTIVGRDLLKSVAPAAVTFTAADANARGTLTASDLGSLRPLGRTNEPVVRFAGTPVTITSARYVASQNDEIVVQIPALPHNTTGTLTLTTPVGVDSLRLSIMEPPSNARVVEVVGGIASTVTNGQLVRGTRYEVRGKHLLVSHQTGANSFASGKTEVTLGGPNSNIPPESVLQFNSQRIDTIISFTTSSTRAFSAPTPLPLVLSHAGGTVTVGSFTLINPPQALDVSGAVVTPNEVIGGTPARLSVSFSPTPTDFTTAGSLLLQVSGSPAGTIPPIAPVQITANPMVIDVPTVASGTTATARIQLRHSSSGGASRSVDVVVRPPRPTALTLSRDTIAGGQPLIGTVAFDLAGPATVFLSSSDPTTMAVPASVMRNPGAATVAFSGTSPVVSAPRTVTLTAALNGVTVSKSVVVMPGRLSTFSLSPTTLTAGESSTATVTFDAPRSAAPLTLTSSDTAVRFTGTRSVSGTSTTFAVSTTGMLAAPVTATLTVSSDGISKAASLSVNPIALTEFSIAPASGTSGTTVAATLRLSRAALVQHSLSIVSSDPTVAATVDPVHVFSIGETVKVISILLKPGQTAARTVTFTVNLLERGNPNAPVIGTRTATVTVTP